MAGASIVSFVYTNYRGETRRRTVTPLELTFHNNDAFHPGFQWFVRAWENAKGYRNFPIKQCRLLKVEHKGNDDGQLVSLLKERISSD